MTLFDVWKYKKYPCPPFTIYFSVEFEHGVDVDVVIFFNPGDFPKNWEDVSFFEKDGTRIEANIDIAQIYVGHNKYYHKEGLGK
jgi:hypothetical protein